MQCYYAKPTDDRTMSCIQAPQQRTAVPSMTTSNTTTPTPKPNPPVGNHAKNATPAWNMLIPSTMILE